MNTTPQRGLFVFTATGQYTIMDVTGEEERPRYEGETITGAGTLATYSTLVANSGRCMADWNTETRANTTNVTFSITDGILTLTWLDGFDPGTRATLRRPGQPTG